MRALITPFCRSGWKQWGRLVKYLSVLVLPGTTTAANANIGHLADVAIGLWAVVKGRKKADQFANAGIEEQEAPVKEPQEA